MRRRTTLATVASLVTASAGCIDESDPTGSDENDTETTGTDGNDTETTGTDGNDAEATADEELAAALETFEFPPGAGRDGLHRELVDAHEERLAASGSFRTTRRSERSGEKTFTRTRTAVVDGNTRLISSDDSGFMAPVEYWIDGDDVLIRNSNESGERYIVGDRSRVTETLARSRTLRALIDAATYEPSEFDDSGDTPVVVFESVDVDRLDPLGRVQYVSRYDELDASIEVSEAGVVGYRYELRGEGDDGPVAVTESATFDDVGAATLEEPEWVEEGWERARDLSFEPTEDASAFVVTIERGNPIPAGVKIDLLTNRHLTGELDQEFTQGQTLYLYDDGDTLGVAVDSEPDSDAVLDARTARVRFYTETGLLLYDGSFRASVPG